MSNLPSWARKPKHKKTVVATPRGWMVKETGEYLKLVRDLDERLKALQTESAEVTKSISEDDQSEAVSTYSKESEVPEKAVEDAEVAEQPADEEPQEEKPKRKRGGRPRKSESTDNS